MLRRLFRREPEVSEELLERVARKVALETIVCWEVTKQAREESARQAQQAIIRRLAGRPAVEEQVARFAAQVDEFNQGATG